MRLDPIEIECRTCSKRFAVAPRVLPGANTATHAGFVVDIGGPAEEAGIELVNRHWRCKSCSDATYPKPATEPTMKVSEKKVEEAFAYWEGKAEDLDDRLAELNTSTPEGRAKLTAVQELFVGWPRHAKGLPDLIKRANEILDAKPDQEECFDPSCPEHGDAIVTAYAEPVQECDLMPFEPQPKLPARSVESAIRVGAQGDIKRVSTPGRMALSVAPVGTQPKDVLNNEDLQRFYNVEAMEDWEAGCIDLIRKREESIVRRVMLHTTDGSDTPQAVRVDVDGNVTFTGPKQRVSNADSLPTAPEMPRPVKDTPQAEDEDIPETLVGYLGGPMGERFERRVVGVTKNSAAAGDPVEVALTTAPKRAPQTWRGMNPPPVAGGAVWGVPEPEKPWLVRATIEAGAELGRQLRRAFRG